MDSASWEKAKDLVTGALKLPAAERDTFLRDHCPDPAIRAEVDVLLKRYDDAPDSPTARPRVDPGDDFEDLPAGTRVGPYVIIDRLGRGGMGQVFLGSDPRLRRRVALKCLTSSSLGDEESRARILKEARAAARINHPNVATIHDVIEHESRAFIVMEYVAGENLAKILRRDRLPVDRVIAIGRQLASALRAAHTNGVVHRDLKPGNIQVTPDGTVKVLDFGVAKAASTLTSVPSDASTGEPPPAPLTAVVKPGTPGYMSPEHLLGHPPDERSDIYSLGVVLFEMATGRRPYPQTTVGDLVIALVAGPPRADTFNPGLPRPLIDIIEKALEQNPNKRFQSASELESALAALDVPATRSDPAALARRRRLTVVLAIAGAIAVVAISYLGVHSRSRLARPTLVKAIHSVAVLPLVNLSGQPEQDYFVDGMTEGLINALGHVSALTVTARTSVMPFRKTTKSLAEIAAALDVDALIEGSATIAPGPSGKERVRVTVNLIDPASQKQLWNDSIERDLDDVLSIQSEIARALADDINVAVTPDERVRLTARQTVNPHAYKLFLLGRQQWNSRTQPALTRALDYFKQAIAVDPDYAPAHAGLADTYVLLAGEFGAIARDVGASEATASASRAIALDPGLGEAYASLAFTNFFLKWDWLRAEEQFKQALRLSPNYATAHQWYGNYLSDMGREDEGLNQMRRALELDPLEAIISRDVAWPLFFSRRYDEAIQQLKLTLAQHPGYLPAERLLARAYAQKGDFREALPRFEALKARDDTSRTRCELAWAYARANRRDDASRVLKTVYDAGLTAPYPYDLALIFTAQNRVDEAFDALNRAFEQRDPTMVNLKHDPRFDALRADPRYARLLALMRFPG